MLPPACLVSVPSQAARKGFIKIAQTLLRYDGDVDAVAESSGRTALWWACCWGNANVVRLLIEHGADHSRSDARGMRPLDVALRRPLRRRDLCVRLLEVRCLLEPLPSLCLWWPGGRGPSCAGSSGLMCLACLSVRLVQEADRSFMLWKARTLHDWEATKACAGSACLPAAAHPLPLAGVLAAAGSSRVAAMPTVRIQTETKQEDSQPAASPAMPAAAAAACGAAGAAAASISSETGEGSVAAESGEALVTDVARFVVQQLNGDLFREMMDIFFRTCSLPQEVGNKEGGLVR